MVYVLILQGEVALLWGASSEGRLEVVEALVDRGADINQTIVRAYHVYYTAELLYPMCMACVGRAISVSAIVIIHTMNFVTRTRCPSEQPV